MPKKVGDGRDYEKAAKILQGRRNGQSITDLAESFYAPENPIGSKQPQRKASLESERQKIKKHIKKSKEVFSVLPSGAGIRTIAKKYEEELNCVLLAELKAAESVEQYNSIDKSQHLHMVDIGSTDKNNAQPMTKDELFHALEQNFHEAIFLIQGESNKKTE